MQLRYDPRGATVDEHLLQHVSPLGWEHINLTGDYVWRQNRKVERRRFRPSERFPRLSVLYIPFREATPTSVPMTAIFTPLVPPLNRHRNTDRDSVMQMSRSQL